MLNKGKCLIYGDSHLSSSNYGGHIDYASESLENFRRINVVAKEEDCGVVIGAGDLAQHRFNKLEYKLAIEDELDERNEITDHNYFEVKGNHDSMTSGMSEWEFYHKKGYLRNEPYVDVGCARIHMVNYGEEDRELDIAEDKFNIVVGHNYFKYKSTVFPNYGKAIELDYKESWAKVDLIVAGHIHDILECTGKIGDKEIPVIYLGCPNQLSYKKDGMDEVGMFIILDCTGTEPQIVKYEFDLRPISERFVGKLDENDAYILDENGYAISSDFEVKDGPRLDVSDVIEEIANSDITLGDPEKIIDVLSGFSSEARELAKELYKEALNS